MADNNDNRAPIGMCAKCGKHWWTIGLAHCSVCCESFSSWTLFDMHMMALFTPFRPCLKPDEIMRKGERAMFQREDGVWRGPEMPEEARVKLRTSRP